MENTTLTRNRKLALTGAFSALVIVLGITKLGLIPLGPTASISILQIPMFIALMLAGLSSGAFVGAVFGIMSLIMAAMSPSGVLDPLFVNPLCSVLPRVLTAVVAWAIWKALNLIPHMPKTISAALVGFLGTLAHTSLVIGCLYIFQGGAVREAMGGMGYLALMGVLSFNAVLEAVAATIVCTAVFAGLFISSKKKSKLSQE
ncbi:MAG: ECF transporter S component [Treponema sp.]|nr:ECF transporter S component [Treponema sp.]